jgi:hypothetical protein
MSDHDDPTPTDDLASAHLDGETTPEEAARAAADPEVATRLEALRVVRDRLRAAAVDEPVDPRRRDAAIAAALDAFDEAGAAAPQADRPDAPLPLAPRAARRAAAGRWRTIGIAAAIALVALAVPLLSRLGSDDAEDLASSGDAATEESTSTARTESGAALGGSGEDTSAFSATADRAPLGSFEDVDELAAAVRGQLDRSRLEGSEAAPAAGGADVQAAGPCAGEAERKAAGGTRSYEGYATLDGADVVVLVVEQADGTRTLVLLDVEDCTEVTTRAL